MTQTSPAPRPDVLALFSTAAWVVSADGRAVHGANEAARQLGLSVGATVGWTPEMEHAVTRICSQGSGTWPASALPVRGRPVELPDGTPGALLVAEPASPSAPPNAAFLADLAQAVDLGADAVALTDPEGRYVYMNPPHWKMFGFSGPDEVIGQPWSILYTDEVVSWFEAEVFGRHLGGPGTQWTGTVEGRHRAGGVVMQEVSLTIRSNGGILCITRDIGPRLAGDARRRALETQLSRTSTNLLTSTLMRGLAHDVRNALQAIRMRAELAAEVPELAQEAVGGILSTCDRTTSMLTGVLELGSEQRQRELCDLAAIVTDATDMLRALLGVGARLQLDLEPGLFYGSTSRLTQVLLNLVVNARDALGGRPGRIAVRTGTTPRLPPPGWQTVQWGTLPTEAVLLEVTDSGEGMTPARLGRLDEAGPGRDTGVHFGIGLSVVRAVCTQHKAAVTIASRPQEGTRFTVWLPAAPASAQKGMTSPA